MRKGRPSSSATWANRFLPRCGRADQPARPHLLCLSGRSSMDLLLILLINGIANGSQYALLGLGFGLIFSSTRIVHFAYGTVFTFAAYVTWACIARLEWPTMLAVAAGIAASALLG